jgi:hypothetical protein
MMRAKDCVPAGGSFHVSAGEMLRPIQEYFAGIDCPFANASLLSSRDMSASVVSVVLVDVHDETMMMVVRNSNKRRFIESLLVSLHRTA